GDEPARPFGPSNRKGPVEVVLPAEFGPLGLFGGPVARDEQVLRIARYERHEHDREGREDHEYDGLLCESGSEFFHRSLLMTTVPGIPDGAPWRPIRDRITSRSRDRSGNGRWPGRGWAAGSDRRW